MKIVIPLAGHGSRLRPHTYTTPKPLMKVAGKRIIDYVFKDVEKLNPDEIVLIVGYHKEKIMEYVLKNYSNLNVSFVEQTILDGDGGAIRIALNKLITEYKDDEIFIIFGADTLIDFDIKKEIGKVSKNVDALIFGMEVEHPENYGIMNVDKNLNLVSVEEKPKKPKSNLAIIGAYYFKSFFKVKNYLDYYYQNEIKVKNEYKLVQVIESYINNKKLKVKVSKVNKWFDCGRPEVILEANRYFLKKLSNNNDNIMIKGNNIIIPPCFISKGAKLENSIVGPYVSLDAGTEVKDVIIKNSIIGEKSKVDNLILENSLIGSFVLLSGKKLEYNIGDNSRINLN